MIDWRDPSRWLVLQYRVGTGGKFICACLMTIDCVHHWDDRVESGEITHQSWVSQFWRPPTNEHWINYEPTIHWNTDFYSRTWPRGNDLDIDTYNVLMEQSAGEWQRRCWKSGKILLDWVNKSSIPVWQQSGTIVRLDVKDRWDSGYVKALRSKLFPWDPSTGIGIVLIDKPFACSFNSNAVKFSNSYEFGPFDTEKDWFEWLWKTYPVLNWSMNPADIWFEDLLDFKKVDRLVRNISDKLGSGYDQSALKFTHDFWTTRHKELLNES